MSKPNVLVTLDSMKYPNTGLFHFGKSLGNALIKENNNFDLTYYIYEKSESYFAGKVKLLKRITLHKLWFTERNQFKITHFTDQFCRLNPHQVNGRKILTIHDLNQLYDENWQPSKLKRYMDRLGGYIDACHHIVAISNFVAGEVLTHFPQAKDKLTVIYNGADKPELVPDHTPIYQPGKQFLFTIGMLTAKKNFQVLPALLNGNDMELVIAGIESDYKEKIITEAEKYGCAGRVKITGPISDADKAWYYKNCEAFVFPSLAEGFGLPVIEAMHFGKPVFLSKYTSLPEVGGDAAWYFDSFDGKAMQNTFLNGLREFHDKKLSTVIQQHAIKFNWEHTAKQYLALYQKSLIDS
jgi:glycosyltransferase involved in cell wall biosynthesis